MDIFSFLCLTYRRRRAAAATERAGGGLRAHRSVMLPNEAPDIEREGRRLRVRHVFPARVATQIERKCARVVKALICWAERD